MRLVNNGADGISITPESPDDERILFGFLMMDKVVNTFDELSMKALDAINPDLDVDDCMNYLSNEMAGDSYWANEGNAE